MPNLTQDEFQELLDLYANSRKAARAAGRAIADLRMTDEAANEAFAADSDANDAFVRALLNAAR